MNVERSKSVWADAGKIDKLIALDLAGWSTQRIGDEIGVSKNAVISKLHRLGRIGDKARVIARAVWSENDIGLLIKLWNDRATTSVMSQRLNRTEASIKDKAYKMGLPKRAKPTQLNSFKYIKPRLVDVAALSPLPDSLPVGLAERTGCCCPVGQATGEHQLFCNAPVDSGPYCSYHKSILFNASYHPKSVIRAGRYTGA